VVKQKKKRVLLEEGKFGRSPRRVPIETHRTPKEGGCQNKFRQEMARGLPVRIRTTRRCKSEIDEKGRDRSGNSLARARKDFEGGEWGGVGLAKPSEQTGLGRSSGQRNVKKRGTERMKPKS